MKKKIALLLVVFTFMQTTLVQAATQFKVISMNDFSTEKPSESIDVKLPQDVELYGYNMMQSSIVHCDVVKVVDPKRGKRNASFYVQPIYYTFNGRVKYFQDDIYAKYSRKLLSKDELKKIEPIKVAKNAALIVGEFFVTGISLAYNFTEGIVKNEKDNRLKSGVVNAYEESPLSIINEGNELDIKTGDFFYLVVKKQGDEDKPNYTYTTPDEQSENDCESRKVECEE